MDWVRKVQAEVGLADAADPRPEMVTRLKAYPRLVDVLRDLTGFIARYPDWFVRGDVNMEEYCGRANELLRELGELPSRNYR